MEALLYVVLCFNNYTARSKCGRILGLDRNTIAKICNALESLITVSISEHPVKFYGKGIYEIDEAQVKHVKLVENEYFNNIWICGIFERATGKAALIMLPDRSSTTLLG